MTMANERAERPVVTVLRRPPVRQSTLVRASAQHTFTTFVTTIGAWWPAQPFSAGKDRVRESPWSNARAAGSTRPGTTAPTLTGARWSRGSPPNGSP